MPIYEYECKKCGHKMEALQRMSDDPLKDCPECNAPELKKLISAAGFRLSGSGWYETDFKSGNKKNLTSADTAASPKKEKSPKKESKASPKKGSRSAAK
ncbi:MAG: zinc ribbon domain-containing protein [Gammaproteobacteria bacterium]|nr:zinc ribbon domain-containing protein [Gammaproteobacteria bacterium]